MIIYLLALPALIAPFASGFRPVHVIWQRMLSLWLTLSAVFLVFMETVTPPFIIEYDVRPNRLFVEYLVYPKEVCAMIFKGYRLELLAGVVVMVAVLWIGGKWSCRVASFRSDWTPLRRALAFPLVVLLLLGGARSSLGHRPANPSSVAFSGDHYATGTRSVRGIEALITGFLPTPARSVVKLGKAQKGFFSLAAFLEERGYHTRFVYGGDSAFDNMNGFFLGNGFQEIVDQNDFEQPQFVGSWGVSDEDLFDKAHELFSRKTGKPFFTLVFSSSNHTPFEFPDNTIELYEQPKNTVNNAVKYADHALGRFFEKARRSNYWNNTIFLVVADHNSRVYGNVLVPMERFRIPGLLIGPGIAPGVYSEIASQIDLPPTLLSLAGVSGNTPMLGRDLTQKADSLPGRAIMQFYKNQAYYEGEQVVIHQPGNIAKQFTYKGGALRPAPLDEKLTEKALAHALWASWTYKKQLYRN